MIHQALDHWARGSRGAWLAAAVALIAGLPGLFALPALDRDESRFAQASAQMLESRDYVAINFQDEPRDKKPVGIYWLQALSVAALSAPEARQIWAYRIPSLLGAMIAAAACAWGAAAFFGAGRGFLAGAILGATFLLSTEASIAKTDAVLCGCVTLMMAAFARLYASSRGEIQTGRVTQVLFWLALAGAALVKGPVGPLIAILTGLMLWAWDRKAPWLRTLGWGWGIVLLAAMLGPWAAAITVATDGAFWSGAVGGDLAPKLAGGHESHGAPPGLHLLLSPLLTFPAALLLPAALVFGWQARERSGVRFAVAWLVPTWLMFELLPTKLVHYTLPTFAALAWLMVGALGERMGERVRWAGAGAIGLAAAAFAAVSLWGAGEYGDRGDTPAALLAAALFIGTGLAGGLALVRGPSLRGLAAVLALGIAAHGVLVGMLAPGLEALWLSQRTAQALRAGGLDPRNGVTPGPVAVAGFGEPSLVFSLGTLTELGAPEAAAAALASGRPAIVEQRVEPTFRAAARARGIEPRLAGVVAGRNYSDGDEERLLLFGAPVRP